MASFRVHLEDVGSGDIGRHEVRSKLNPLVFQVECFRDSRYQESLREAWDPDQQSVSPAEHGHQNLLNLLFLPHDHAGQFFLHPTITFMEPLYRGLVFTHVRDYLRNTTPASCSI